MFHVRVQTAKRLVSMFAGHLSQPRNFAAGRLLDIRYSHKIERIIGSSVFLSGFRKASIEYLNREFFSF